MSISSAPLPGVLIFVLLVSALLRYAFADEFTNPSNSNADLSVQYTLGETVQVRWNCSLDQITLLVSHWGGDAVGALLSDALNPGAYTWTVGQNDNVDDQQISQSPNFVLLIRDPSGQIGTGDGFVDNQLSSRAFVVKSNDTSSSSSTSSTSTSLSSTSTTSIPSSSPTAASSTSVSAFSVQSTSAAPAATSSNSSTDLSTGAKAGIGVGAALGSLFVLALGIFLGMRCVRKSKKQQAANPPGLPGNTPYEVAGSVGDMNKYVYSQQVPVHAQYRYNDQPVTELPSNHLTQETTTMIHEMGGEGHPRDR